MYFQDYCNSTSRTLIMGIINVTPDSFYDGGKYLVKDALVNRIIETKNISCQNSILQEKPLLSNIWDKVHLHEELEFYPNLHLYILVFL